MSKLTKIYSALVFVSLLANPIASNAGELVIGNSLQIGDDLKATESKLKEFCQRIVVVNADSPRFPLAANSEQHLICKKYQNSDVSFEKAVFVIADERFAHMEAIGVSVPALEKMLGEPNGKYLGMKIFADASYWLSVDRARLVWLHDNAKHPNLFSWNNPYLSNSEFQYTTPSIEIPNLLNFDKGLNDLRPLFADHCKQVQEEHHENVWLLSNPDEQIQINCFGYHYAGFDRKFEAVFGDGKLQLVWILTAKAEESRLRTLLVERWGKAEMDTAKWEVYADGRISLRKDKPELLVLSDEMIPLYRGELESE